MVILGVHVSLCFYPIIFGFLWRSGSVLERDQMLLKANNYDNKKNWETKVWSIS